jgi:hypothetical protein
MAELRVKDQIISRVDENEAILLKQVKILKAITKSPRMYY